MTVTSHLSALRDKHQALSLQVEAAQRAPAADAQAIAEMKKRKLRLKEEITRLSAH